MVFFAFIIFILFNSNSAHAPEKYLENWLHVIDKHLLKIFFLFIQLWIFLILPHLVNDTFIYVPISYMGQELLPKESKVNNSELQM